MPHSATHGLCHSVSFQCFERFARAPYNAAGTAFDARDPSTFLPTVVCPENGRGYGRHRAISPTSVMFAKAWRGAKKRSNRPTIPPRMPHRTDSIT